MAVGHQDHGRVAMPVAAMLSDAVPQPLDLALGEVAPLDCQVYVGWSAVLGSRVHRGKTLIIDVECLTYVPFSHPRKFGVVRGGCWCGSGVACFGLPPWKKLSAA